jgi:hypothetical protein
MSKNNIVYLFLCLVYNYLITSYYRPYIYSHKIDDFGLADIGNNISFIPGVYLLMRVFNQKYIYSKKGDILFHFIVLSCLEILSGFIPHIGTFDIKDILGLLIGAILLFLFIKNDK